MGKLKDLSKLDEGQTVMARRLRQSSCGLFSGCSGHLLSKVVQGGNSSGHPRLTHAQTCSLFTEKDGLRGLNQQTVAQIGAPLNAKRGTSTILSRWS